MSYTESTSIALNNSNQNIITNLTNKNMSDFKQEIKDKINIINNNDDLDEIIIEAQRRKRSPKWDLSWQCWWWGWGWWWWESEIITT